MINAKICYLRQRLSPGDGKHNDFGTYFKIIKYERSPKSTFRAKLTV